MRRITQYILMASALMIAGLISGCITDTVPPADGIYTGTITTASGADNIYAIIDSSNVGVIIDTTHPSITRFTITSIDDSGNFTAPTIGYAGSGFGVVGGTTAVSGSITGTLNGDTGNVISGGSADRNTITGNIITSVGGSQPYTLTYQSNTYEDNVVPLSTIVTSTNGSQPALTFNYSYTAVGGAVASNAVTLNLSTTQQTLTTTSTTITGYSFTGTDSTAGCNYTGIISMPSASFNAFYLTMSASASCVAPGNYSGLAYVNGTSPTNLTLEYDDGNAFAVAANAALAN